MNTFQASGNPVALMVLLLFFGCNKTNSNRAPQAEAVSQPAAQKEAALGDTTMLPRALIQETTLNEDSVAFMTRIDSLEKFFFTLGFKREPDTSVIDPKEDRSHWWLKKYSRSTLGKTPEFPSEEDLRSIIGIRQVGFKKVWTYKVEQWSFESDVAAQRWYDLATAAKGRSGSYYLEKPPNDFWLEGSKLYFIMSTTASDWFEHGEQVIENFSGMSTAEIRQRSSRD